MKITKNAAYTGALIFAALLCLVGKHFSGRHAQEVQKSIGLAPLEATYHGRSLKSSSLGFSNLIADLLWIKLLQKASHDPLKPGEVSWEFAQVDAITTLDPHFIRAYDFGAVFLSVFRRDNIGAKYILEKWVRRSPIHWRPNYLLGYHLYFEMQEYEAASSYVLKAAKMTGAPSYLTALGVRLLSQAGGLWQALKISLELYDQIEDAESKFRMRRRVRAIRYELQRLGWVDALEGFRKKFKREPARTDELIPFFFQKQREISSLPLGEVSEELAELMSERFNFAYDPRSREVRSQLSREQLGIDRVGIHQPPAT